MINKYMQVAVIYGGSGKKYAEAFKKRVLEKKEQRRYPVSLNMVLERVLTGELLGNVVDLFRDSDFCVAFLTADDFVDTNNGHYKSLRQNLVFELGMAVIKLTPAKCIFLSDFDKDSPDVFWPSDMKSIEIANINNYDFDVLLDDVIAKMFSILAGNYCNSGNKLPTYDYLLSREKYPVDYENLFKPACGQEPKEGLAFVNQTLLDWRNECEGLEHFDEKCVFIAERLALIPMFGKTKEVDDFFAYCERAIETYDASDIEYYGSTEILDFTKDVLKCVIDYNRIKEVHDFNAPPEAYVKLVERFNLIDVPEDITVNPLILLCYYDYLGLTCMKDNKIKTAEDKVRHAIVNYEKSEVLAKSVDMGLSIWKGFLTFNLARAYGELNDIENANKYFTKTIHYREKWMRCSNFNVTVRTLFSYEYFLSQIRETDFKVKSGQLSKDESPVRYSEIDDELCLYADVDGYLDQIKRIHNILKDKIRGED